MKNPTIYDPYPNYEPAGIKSKFPDEGAHESIKPKSYEGPGTPEHIKRYRKSYKNAAGQTITHYGKVNDPLPPQDFAYGVGTLGSEHVPQAITDKGLYGVNGFIRELHEEQYSRNKLEPLGKGISRNYQFPEKTKQDEFRFGVATNLSESAKDVMYTPASLEDDQAARDLYIKSHGMYEAGEQRKRNYHWPVNPKDHVFGKTEKLVTDEARYCLQQETVDDRFPKTQIVKKNVEDFKDFNEEPLGKVKNLAQTNPHVGPEHVYGYKPKDKEPWNVEKCIRGEAVYNQVKEEDSLGRATKFGFRNIPKSEDNDRVFGVPTIRNDIKKPALRSVADPNNYGDEPNSVGLLFPQRFSDIGVGKEDFEALRPKEDIRKMFANIGYNYKPGKFEGVFQRAQQLSGTYGTYDDRATVRAYIQAIKEMDHLE